MPIQDAWQVHLSHEGQEHHKIINAFRGNLHFFFHAPQYASYFHFCLSCYANVKFFFRIGDLEIDFSGVREQKAANTPSECSNVLLPFAVAFPLITLITVMMLIALITPTMTRTDSRSS